jgi:serine/threonine protein kinase
MTVPVPLNELLNRAGSLAASIPLLPNFRFTHEPIGSSGESRFVGRDAELQRLAERILFSDGGSFLIAGYRGVGKTSFVNRVIRRVRELAIAQRQLVGTMDVVDVHLMLARPMEAVELMHHIVRQLRERLIELNAFQRLPVALQQDIELAHQRTSMSLSLKRATKIGGDAGLSELGLSIAGVGVRMLRKKTTELTSGREWSYLAYDDRAAESDVMRIAEQIADGYEPHVSWIRRVLHAIGGDGSAKIPLKIIFVFDELDKIDEDASRGGDGQPFLDRLLGHLKNLFTTSHISFIFVAGKDLYDRWLLDVGRGDSVYESVFCYDRYIPCMWTDVEEVCRSVIPIQGLIGNERASCDEFIAFLKYKGRGIPRKLLREFHYYVELRGDRLQLSFNRDDCRRFRFYSELQMAIDDASLEMFGATSGESSAIEYDKKRLAAYYLIDWVLTNGVSEFLEEQAVARSRELSAKIAPAEDLATSSVSLIMRMLVKYEFLEEVDRQGGDKTILPEIDGRGRKRYRLTDRRRAELHHFAAVFEDEKGSVSTPPQPDSRFRILGQIGEGGMSQVYRAWDEKLQRNVALKVLSDDLAGEPAAQRRFIREGEILQRLDHPNIVHFYGEAALGTKVAFAMELVDGVSLMNLITIHPNLPPPFVIAIAVGLTRALLHVHDCGISRIDLKPSNIMIRRDGQPKLTDFGIARPPDLEIDVGDRLTKEGFLLGTPHYMAPENIREPRDADPRSDIYSFGVVLFEMLTGRLPFDSRSLPKLIDAIYSHRAKRISEVVDVPPQLDELVDRCLNKSPADRPPLPVILETLTELPTESFDSAAFVAQCIDKRAEADQAKNKITSDEPLQVDSTGESNGPITLVSSAVPNDPGTLTGLDEEPTHVEAYLEITAPEELAGRVHALTEGRCRIGRSEGIELQILDPSLSRHHADVIARDSSFFVHDLNSANGTAVNGITLREDRELAHGDIIRIGRVTLVFKREISR